ncbi:MAG: hypothetical protein VX080_07520, partial [SAR324 cluster bacterium]|nr:hypothetical protein [SAR324 cluster bacterium]
LLMLFLASGIPRFSFTWANDEMFGKNDPVQKSLDRIKELFGGTTALPMIYRPVDGDLFSKRSLQALQKTRRLLDQAYEDYSDIPENPLSLLKDTESLINTTFIEVEGDSIRFRDFIGEDIPEDDFKSNGLRDTAMAEPDYRQVLISDNGEYGMLMIRTHLGELPLEEIHTDSLSELEEGFEDAFEKKTLSRNSSITVLKIMRNLKKRYGCSFNRNRFDRIFSFFILVGEPFTKTRSGQLNTRCLWGQF